jgi:hypothetical protein
MIREHLARKSDNEFGKIIHLTVHRDRAAMLLRDDVIGDRQPKPRAFAGRFRGEERLEQLVSDLDGMPVSKPTARPVGLRGL